jgi:DNA invertase Pin-like site-specific DNA recombinase
LVFHVFVALAEFERNLIRERTLAGLRAARARGRKGGRPAKLSPKDLKTVRALFKTDLPVTEIAVRLELPDRRSIEPFLQETEINAKQRMRKMFASEAQTV